MCLKKCKLNGRINHQIGRNFLSYRMMGNQFLHSHQSYEVFFFSEFSHINKMFFKTTTQKKKINEIFVFEGFSHN